MTDWLRNRPKRDLLLALAIAAVFALGVGAFFFAARSGSTYYVEARHEVEHEQSGGVVYDRSFDVSPGAQLVVRVSDLDVSVSANSGRQVTVVLEVDEDEHVSESDLERMGFRVERTSEGVEITTEGRDRGDFDLDGALRVTVPRQFDVRVQTGDGDVAVEAVEGAVTLRTGDGDIALGGASGAEVMIQTGDGDVALGGVTSREVTVQTGDGDVAVGRVSAGQVQVRTGDGDIHIEELSGALRASTGDGNVTLAIAEFAGIEITTGDGDVTLYAPASLAADVSIRGGELMLAEGFSLPARIEGRTLEGALNGGGPRLSIRIGDGTVRLIER